MAVDAPPITADELLRMPDDGLRRELVQGELRMMTPAGWAHGCVAAAVAELLRTHARTTESGAVCGAETGFVLSTDPDTVRAPDAAFVSRERVEKVGNTTKYWPGAPDLAVEVVSPEDRFHEVEGKALEWLTAGSIAVLVLDPAKQTATVYRRQGDVHIYRAQDTLNLDDAVPGFSVVVAKLFP